MQNDNNIIQAFKTINIVYIALGMGMILSSGVFYFLVETGSAGLSPDLSPVLRIVVPVLGISGFAVGKYFYGVNATRSKAVSDENQKLAIYRTTSLISWAMLEGPGMFASIAYFLTGDQLFMAFFAMIFLGFLFSKPSMEKFQQDF